MRSSAPPSKQAFRATNRADRARKSATFDLAPSVFVALGDDVDTCRASVKASLALYVRRCWARLADAPTSSTAMDTPKRPHHVQALYLSGREREAAAAIPDALVDAVALCRAAQPHCRRGSNAGRQAPLPLLNPNTLLTPASFCNGRVGDGRQRRTSRRNNFAPRVQGDLQPLLPQPAEISHHGT